MSPAGKAWLLGSLYLAQGLPYGFFTQALPVLLREQGLSLTAIGATSLLFAPWALKFAWASLVDHIGTYRQWLLVLQLAAVAVALAIGSFDLTGTLGLLLLVLFVFNLIAATQDIATDGLAVRLLSPVERGLGNGLQVGGYRLGMILGGGLLLWVFARYGWTAMCLTMAGLLACTVIPVLGLRTPPAHRPGAAPPAWRQLMAGWWMRLRRPGIPTFIALICVYKFGNSMGSGMVGPYLHDMGMGKEQIALIKGTLGSAATLAGAALGGWLTWRLGRRTALLVAGLLEAGALAVYALTSFGIGGLSGVAIACVAEHLLGGMAVVALFTLMMDACAPDHASTDYTLLACALVLGHGAATISGGWLAEHAGYRALFASATVISAAGCLFLIHRLDRRSDPPELARVWSMQRA
ncbi:Predicted arabinose efflux permease, MFS family [Fontimonas thermophila]|uniref:Predicted arabinose efflux permease, MFS family n=1 Tax=Fontimonas thermophila TaxID=1076937 RepID=A0A1I2JJC0_9GAMM|nr:MFS transporter [Fontimonas thermophila]SFF54694.1 Predicted arabinose efflux permease, MFS family [Fontimonas thermophila]